jgi:hypothetical protein
MRLAIAITLPLLVLMTAPAHTIAQSVEIRGRVLDQHAQPVAGARLALRWNFQGKQPTPQWTFRTKKGMQSIQVVSDADGRFVGRMDPGFLPGGVFVIDKEMKTGAIFVVGKNDTEKEFEVTLQPLARVHGKFKDDLPGLRLTSSYAYVSIPGVRMGIASNLSAKPSFDLLLPPGRYNFRFAGTDRKFLRKSIVLRKGQTEHDFGSRSLPAKSLALMYGKTAPAVTVTDARSVGKDITLADYKGRWLLIEFWGFW